MVFGSDVNFRDVHCFQCVWWMAVEMYICLKRSGARRLKFDKDGGRSKLVKGRFEIDMDEFGVDKDVIRTSSTRSIR